MSPINSLRSAAEPVEAVKDTIWPAPNMSILSRSAAPAPELRVEVFGGFWRAWLSRAADASNAPVDYVAMPLLATSAALIGNARWVVAWPGWAEPACLWCASVGNPSQGKTPGATPITRDARKLVESEMGRLYPKELEAWKEREAVGRAAVKEWQKAVEKAIKCGGPVPPKPDLAFIPPKPVRPRLSVTDATVESIAPLLQGLPKGLLNQRDELAGWMSNMARYANGGSDRPFWLESYVGGPFQVDRRSLPDPIFIPHLTVSVFGTIQPERLAELLEDSDDGLSSRFLWTWPEATKPFARPRTSVDPHQAATAFKQLDNLLMGKAGNGDMLPHYKHLSEAAASLMEAFGRQMQRREAAVSGLMKSAIGKARGQALRLALILEYLWWCGADDPGQEPAEISAAAMEAAASLMEEYFLPMAARVLGDSAIPASERRARTLAEYIRANRLEVVNITMIRDTARLPGLRETDNVKAACQFLAEAGWLRAAPLKGAAGRPPGDWVVNPMVHEAER